MMKIADRTLTLPGYRGLRVMRDALNLAIIANTNMRDEFDDHTTEHRDYQDDIDDMRLQLREVERLMEEWKADEAEYHAALRLLKAQYKAAREAA